MVTENKVTGNYGGIEAKGSGITELVLNQVLNNSSTGIALDAFDGGTILSRNNRVTDNDSESPGGGLALSARRRGSVLVTDTLVSDNSSQEWGGGIYVFARDRGSVDVVGTTVSSNRAEGGAGMYTDGNATVEHSTLSGNTAEDSGGGIRIRAGELTVRHSTITNNIADGDGDGDGSGGGVSVLQGFSVRGLVTLDHTIVSGNHDHSGAAEDVAGRINSSFSLIGVGADFLGPLADNGGPAPTHALRPVRLAVDVGDSWLWHPSDYDQRGAPFSRVVGGRIDIGAFERGIPGDADGDGKVDFTDFLILSANFPGGISWTQGNFDGSDDGVQFDDFLAISQNFGLVALSRYTL